MAYLFDTNIFLEILLNQHKKDQAKKLIAENVDNFFISDFSLHSIGVILMKQKRFDIFRDFIDDLIPFVTILSLPQNKYSLVSEIGEKYNLDFDDSYQVIIAKENKLTIVTMDKDFDKVKSYISTKFF